MVKDANFTRIDTDLLFFDPANPRLPATLDGSDDQAVLNWMLGEAGLVELMGSIAVKGFFPAEPLLVTARTDGDGYWVLEGNRRLAAVMLLREPSRAPRRKIAVEDMASAVTDSLGLETLPCAIFADKSEVLDYLGYRHITGIKQWEPAAKARYLDELYNEHLDDQQQDIYRYIARLIGSRSDYVQRLLGSLRLYELVEHDESELGIPAEEISFSFITLALNYASIVEYLGLVGLRQEHFKKVSSTNLDSLSRWMFQERPDIGRTQLGESRNMKALAAAVAHPEGLAALERGETAEEAATATFDADDLLVRALRGARDRLGAAQNLLHRARYTPTATTMLDEVEELAEQIRLILRRKERAARHDDV